MPEPILQAGRRETEPESLWISALMVGGKLIVTLILAAIALALFLVGGLVGGYFYLMQPDEELKNQV